MAPMLVIFALACMGFASAREFTVALRRMGQNHAAIIFPVVAGLAALGAPFASPALAIVALAIALGAFHGSSRNAFRLAGLGLFLVSAILVLYAFPARAGEHKEVPVGQ